MQCNVQKMRCINFHTDLYALYYQTYNTDGITETASFSLFCPYKNNEKDGTPT